MKYLKTFEANSHWKNSLFDKVKFERKEDIKELFYPLIDIGMSFSIDEDLKKNGFESAGQRHEYLKDDINLYKSYSIRLYDDNYQSKNMKRIIEIKENEIELIERLKSMNFKMNYSNRGFSINIEIYHPDDIVDKNIFINDIVSSSKKLSIDDAFEKLSSTFKRIATIYKTKSGDVLLYLNSDGKEKYTLDDLYKFTNKVLKDGFEVEKTEVMRKDTEPTGILVSIKKF